MRIRLSENDRREILEARKVRPAVDKHFGATPLEKPAQAPPVPALLSNSEQIVGLLEENNGQYTV